MLFQFVSLNVSFLNSEFRVKMPLDAWWKEARSLFKYLCLFKQIFYFIYVLWSLENSIDIEENQRYLWCYQIEELTSQLL